MIILGIDPGTVRIGIGVLEKRGGELLYKKSGLLEVGGGTDDATKLLRMERSLKKLIKEVKPERAGVEMLFFSKNKKTALAVGQARGVIIKTLVECGVPFVEISPIDTKIAVTGSGSSGKAAVAKMVSMILKSSFVGVVDDATDALAIAIAVSQKTLAERAEDGNRL